MAEKSSSGGFSLIELMIAAAILAIVAAIAIPSYTEHVAKVRRGDAQAALLSLANAMERHKANNIGDPNNRGYEGAALPDIHPEEVPVDGSAKYYRLSISNLSATTYTLSAAPINKQAGDPCGTFNLTHNGTRSLTSASKSLEQCWR